ncbi:MAG TPA: hypothetical protein VGM73_00045 [Candidatus Didemnitutus sp.]|jgi:hypothetical protein
MKTSSIHQYTTRAALFSVLVGSAFALLAGCSSEPETHVVSAPPPGTTVAVAANPAPVQMVAPATTTTLANGTVILTQAPPVSTQPQVIVARPPRPSSDHIWIDGYWTWRDDRYEWVNAHWEAPPSSGSEWITPRWEQRSDGNYNFIEGHWSS